MTGAVPPKSALVDDSGEFRGLNRRFDVKALKTLRMAFDAAREGILLCDAVDKIIFFNRSYAELVGVDIAPGMTFEQVLRLRLAKGVFADAQGREEAWLAERLAGRRARGSGVEMCIGGQWFHVTDQPAPDGGTLTLVVDIDARKRAEQALRESEAVVKASASLFHAIFEQAAVGIAKSALDGRLLEVNQKLCKMLGYTREELLQCSLIDLVEKRDQTVTLASPGTMARVDDSSFVSEKLFICKDGSRLWCNLSRNVTWTPSGAPDYVVSVVEDISARKAAEEAAVEARMRLQDGLEHLGEIVVLTDADDRIVLANRRFVEFNAAVAKYAQPGCRYVDHLEAGIVMGLYPGALGRPEEWLAERLAMRRHPAGPVEQQRQDGRWLLIDDQRLPDGGTVTYGIEITDRKRAEAMMREIQHQFEVALGLTGVSVWEHDLSSDMLSIRGAWPAALNPDQPHLVVKARDYVVPLVHPADLSPMTAMYARMLKGAEDSFESRFRARCGEEGWSALLSRGRVVERDVAGRAVRATGVYIDISELRNAEIALQSSEARFRSLVDLSHDLFWECDEQHRFLPQDYATASGNIPVDALETGKAPWDIPYVSPDDATWARHRARIAARETFRDFEMARRTASGDVRYAQISGEPVYDADGVFRGYRGVGKDITERKKAEEALRALNVELEQRIAERTSALETAYRDLESFSYSVSHDLRAPLRSISGYAGLLRQDEGQRLSDEGRGYLDTIDASARHMGRLIDALLSLARTSRQALHRRRVLLTSVAQRVVEELKDHYPQAAIRIGKLPIVEGDETLLQQVWSNLIGNALKYSAKVAQPQVEIGITEAGDDTVFFVQDNGVGFDMAYADKLFQAFGRLHTDAQFQGTGIGLVLTKLILERHGGRIWVESQPGVGTRFSFTLAMQRFDPGSS